MDAGHTSQLHNPLDRHTASVVCPDICHQYDYGSGNDLHHHAHYK